MYWQYENMHYNRIIKCANAQIKPIKREVMLWERKSIQSFVRMLWHTTILMKNLGMFFTDFTTRLCTRTLRAEQQDVISDRLKLLSRKTILKSWRFLLWIFLLRKRDLWTKDSVFTVGFILTMLHFISFWNQKAENIFQRPLRKKAVFTTLWENTVFGMMNQKNLPDLSGAKKGDDYDK